jgi:2,5-dihydroxypyridine 5,6-dioxygenase
MMDRQIEMVKGVRKIVDDILPVREGEKVLIVTDTGMDPRIPDLFSILIAERGADPVIMTMKPGKFHGAQPPDNVAAAMKQSDVIFEITSIFIGHGPARWDACEAGARYLTLPELNERMLVGPGGLDCDFSSLVPTVEKLKDVVTAGNKLRISTLKGTNLTASIEGRQARGLHGLVHNRGAFMGTPDVEVSIAPHKDTANGVVVVDGFAVGVGLVEDPIVITIEKGIAVKIEGGEEAKALEKMLREANDPNAFILSEIGLGLNPKANLKLGTTLEAEGHYGTAHIALGGTPWPETRLRAPLHIDLVFYKVTYEVDGVAIMKNGDLIDEYKKLSAAYL